MSKSAMGCTLCLSIPESWGNHLRAIAITIVIVISVGLGIDIMP